jgi:hypothetical protein
MTMVTEALSATRHTLHGIAEHLLAAHERRVTGSIRLYLRDGALSTADLPIGPDNAIGRLELRSHYMVRHPDGLVVPIRGSFGALATQLGIEFGMPDPPYTPASGCDADDEVILDPAAAAVLEDAFRVGHRALRRMSRDQPVVWPEHLDVAVTVDGVNYGVSPGDDYLGEPYAYVGPHALAQSARDGDFWNAPFGAARTITALASSRGTGDAADAVLAFFTEGQALAAG